uniref:aspartyl protease family protein n=1 Tax=Streptococcus anginosus TaxID=1328 RepID=UPI002ED8F87A
REARDAPDVVTGTVLLSSQSCRILFDSGASILFISEQFFDLLDFSAVVLPSPISVKLPNGNRMVTGKACVCEIEFSGQKWQSCLVLLP